MIGFIEGEVRFIRNESVLVDVHGVGYELFVPNPFAVARGKSALWFTYDHVTDSSRTLYGFPSEADYEVFLRLIEVRGIGPKSALNILKKASGRHIIEAIEKGDVNALKALPGIGPKTASQMMLDLQGKLVSALKPESAPVSPSWMETRSALTSLGYRPADLEPLEKIYGQSELDTDTLLRTALKQLAKRKGG